MATVKKDNDKEGMDSMGISTRKEINTKIINFVEEKEAKRSQTNS